MVDTLNIPLTSYWNNPTLLSDYGYNSLTENTLIFMVKACADSFVAMKTSTASAVSDDTYELVIGSYGGSRVVMRLNEDTKINLAKTELLSCFAFRPFWLYWTNDSCSLGKGLDVGVDELINWSWNVNTTVKDIGIMTGFGATGQWLFYYGGNLLLITKYIPPSFFLYVCTLLCCIFSFLLKAFCLTSVSFDICVSFYRSTEYAINVLYVQFTTRTTFRLYFPTDGLF